MAKKFIIVKFKKSAIEDIRKDSIFYGKEFSENITDGHKYGLIVEKIISPTIVKYKKQGSILKYSDSNIKKSIKDGWYREVISVK